MPRSASSPARGAQSHRIHRHAIAALFFGALLLAMTACGPSNASIDCAIGELACPGGCANLLSDSGNCGACGIECEAGFACVEGACAIGGGNCDPGASESCYFGPAGTQGVGICRGGTRSCQDNGVWGACLGEVTPITELCNNNIDDNCNGVIDDEADLDGDGWSNCRGDCCDEISANCANPELVNPGAFEVVGNDVDDDCDGLADNPVPTCDSGLASSSGNAMDYAAAMDLCQTADENAPDETRTWGVISARLVLTNGTGSPASNSRAIRPSFGATAGRAGNAMAVLSTGHAAGQNDSNPNFAAFEEGRDMGTSAAMPDDWYAANGNSIPNAPGCPAPNGGAIANDPVMLELRIRAPTNARSFSIDSNFFSAEYPEWTCSPYNDFFVMLLDSSYNATPPNPPDKNLARYTAGNGDVYPVGVNLAFGNTGLFQICENGATGCALESVSGTISTCTSTAGLAGTGMDLGSAGGCGGNDRVGGGTGWLSTSGNVQPGETITLRIAVWDTSDHIYDSVVLLDNFQWSVDASDPGTVIVID